MRVALVHDDLVQWGGAEKVLLEISDMFPDAPIFTSVFDRSQPILEQKFSQKKIFTSFLQKVPGWQKLYKPLLPIYGIAFEQFDFASFDLVISQTTRFAKAIITPPQTKHICYCHTPTRFLWNLPSDQNSKLLNPLLNYLRIYDQNIKTRVDYWIAGSHNCAKRLKKIYQVDSDVLQPFVDDSLRRYSDPVDGDYYLIIARLNSYKKVEVAVDAFNQNGKELKVVGNGPLLNVLKSRSNKNIRYHSGVSDQLLALLISGCKGLIITAEEDFGMTSLEAQLFGKGVIAYGFGGAKETVVAGTTGIFFTEQTSDSLNHAINKFEQLSIEENDCISNAETFSKKIFRQNFTKIIESVI